MTEIEYDPEFHIYRVNGRIMPSVSRILKDSGYGPPHHVPAYVIKHAADRGNAVHEAIELDISGVLDPNSLVDEVADRMIGWFEFRTKYKPEFLASEEKVIHEALEYVGRLDIRCRLFGPLDGQHALIDAKSVAQVRDSHWIQAEGYELAYNAGPRLEPVEQSYVLHLTPELKDNYKLKPTKPKHHADWYRLALRHLRLRQQAKWSLEAI